MLKNKDRSQQGHSALQMKLDDVHYVHRDGQSKPLWLATPRSPSTTMTPIRPIQQERHRRQYYFSLIGIARATTPTGERNENHQEKQT